MTKKTSRKLGLLLLVLAVCFVVYALGHPTGSFPWSNSVTYGVYLVYILLRECFFGRHLGKNRGDHMKVEQFVMAYGVEQDRLRAFLPEGFVSLRPVLRINGEIRTNGTETYYLELNTPVEARGKRGWLNVAHWDSEHTDLTCKREGKAVTFQTPFLQITYTGTGAVGGCPAEKDNDGCFFLEETFRPAEIIDQKKEFCDCAFSWHFTETDAKGVSVNGKTLSAIPTEAKITYPKQPFTAETAAAIPCEQILGAYMVRFERET